MERVNLKNSKRAGFNYHNSQMPVIKIDYKGEILYANMSSFDLLLNWGCYASKSIPARLVEEIKRNNYFETKTMEVDCNNKHINLMVVPFPEAGYIGIYAFEFTSKEINN